MHRLSIKVELVGGVGNQLFQYFAGKALADLQAADLQLDTSLIGVNGTRHDSSLQSINLVFDIKDSPVKRYFHKSLIGRAYALLQRKSPMFRAMNSLLVRFYQAPDLGFDQELLHQKAPLTIAGYFQTRKYFDLVQQNNPVVLNPKSSSTWFRELETELKSKKVVGVHVRRGDYIPLANSFGLIGKKYYLDGIEELRRSYSFEEIWVFSDDIQMAKEVLWGVEGLTFIDPPQESNPIESLFLMSKCFALVISNSTFAWWSGLLSGHNRVLYPREWFKSAEYSKDLLLEEWIPIESFWEIHSA